jgi:hypothetical protein
MCSLASTSLPTILTFAALSFHSAAATAQETPYCRRARARAASDADLLMSPRVILQGIHFPNGGQQVDSGPTAGSGYQVRAGLSFSPVDYYKGLGVLRLGDADCDRHEAAERVQDVLIRGTDDARLSALRAQAEFLRARREDWRALAAMATARLSERIITVVEYTSMQRFADALEHKLVQVEGEANQLGARIPSAPIPAQTPLRSLAGRYFEQSMRFERDASRLRLLDQWKLQLTGGVIPQAPVDWYGVLELSFSVGALLRDRQEEQSLDARADELWRARDEIETKVEQFRAQTEAALEQARRDFGVVEHTIEVLAATRVALERSEGENVAHARDALAVEQISLEADGVFLRAFIDALAALAARTQG